MANSSREDIKRSLSEEKFIARGLASRDHARIAGEYKDAAIVIEQLQQMLLEAKKIKE
ncbi:MAG: hypothetical protein HGA99_04870 [Chlorobiaceae bacterium]|nr:hypothetical protein [Chlorobiaceae bacterium]